MIDEKTKMKCKDCKWWVVFDIADENEGGFCHRFPPIMAGVALAGTYSRCKQTDMEDAFRVITKKDDFCGEFKLRD